MRRIREGQEDSALHTFAIALFPLAALILGNRTTEQFTNWSMIRPAIGVALLVVVLLWLSRAFTPDLRVRAAGLSAWLLAIYCYDSVFAGLHLVAKRELPDVVVAAAYLALATILAVAFAPRLARRENRVLLNGLAAGMVLSTGAVWLHHAAPWSTPAWKTATERIVRATSASALSRPNDSPDVYYFMFDGLTHPDTARRLYGADLGRFERALEERGFALAARSRSNYSQTHLTLASVLNMSYLDDLVRAVGDSGDRAPLHELVYRSGVIQRFRDLGYEFVMVGSDFSMTTSHPLADRCACRLVRGFSELESALITYTPFRVLPMDRLTFGAHRDKVQSEFETAERVERRGRPLFVFVHIMAPHPPFVFEADGRPRAQTAEFSFRDDTNFRGSPEEYRQGYAAQATFLLSQLVEAVDRIDRKGGRPVIIVHGDHGGRLPAVAGSDRNGPRERVSIMAAVRGAGGRLPDDLTPVNVFRLLFDRVFGGSFGQLPNRSFVSDWEHPYRLSEVQP